MSLAAKTSYYQLSTLSRCDTLCAHLSLSTQKVSLRCASAGAFLAAHSGQTPSHSLGSHTGKVSHLERKRKGEHRQNNSGFTLQSFCHPRSCKSIHSIVQRLNVKWVWPVCVLLWAWRDFSLGNTRLQMLQRIRLDEVSPSLMSSRTVSARGRPLRIPSWQQE